MRGKTQRKKNINEHPWQGAWANVMKEAVESAPDSII